MVFKITLPTPGKYKKNAEDLIISILSKEFPLTLMQIHLRIRKNFAVSITYQAVRKTVNKLVSENILIKQDRAYQINRTWILETEKIIRDIRKTYFESFQPKNKIKVGNNVTEYSFNNLIEKDKMWCKLQEEWLDNIEEGESKTIAWQGMHNWWLLAQLEHETRFMNLIKTKVKVYQLINGKSTLDKWSVNYYAKLGVNCIINKDKKINKANYLVVFGDYIMQTFYPTDLVQKLEKFYLKTKNFNDIDLNEIMSILTEHYDIKVTLIKNKEIATKVRKDIMGHFN